MPRTLAQNAQYIAETIKPAIKSAIEAQGVTVPSTDSFLDYADRIGEIEGGGSGYQLKDLPTGAISTVNDAAELPLNALKVSVEAWQEGSGDPSPSNVRPIHGWSEAEININNYPSGYYGMIIHQAVSDPKQRIEYTGINANYTPMSQSDGVVSYGDWGNMPTLTMNKPAMIKRDGTFDYWLKEDDYSKKADNTASDIANLSYVGNAMAYFPALWMKIIESGTDLEVRFAYSQLEPDYYEVCPAGSEGVWLPMFYGCPDSNGYMRSIANTNCLGGRTYNSTTDAQETAIKKNGNDYYFLGGKLLDCITLLEMMWFKTTNSDDIGRGNQYGYNASAADGRYGTKSNPIVGGGKFYLTNDGKTANKILHCLPLATYDIWLRNPYFIVDNGTYKVSKDYSYDTSGATLTNTGLTIPSQGYIKELTYVNGYGLLPKTTGGSTTTYYCDHLWINASIVSVPVCLGGCSDGGGGGFRAAGCDVAAGNSVWNGGCALVLKQSKSNTLKYAFTYTQQFPTTIYGAEWDVVDGELSQTDGYIASYNGETLPSTWISDRDVYASGTTPTIGAEVVYKLATPTTIDLSPLSIRMLQGTNNIYADCGEVIEGEYFVGETKAYDLVEYIESDGTQVIDTGRQVVQGQTIEVTFEGSSNQTAYAWIFGGITSGDYYGYQFPNSSTIYLYNGGTSASSQSGFASDVLAQKALTFNGSANANIHILGLWDGSAYSNQGKFKVYSLDINGDYFVPVKRRSDGVYGLYDIANSQFLTDVASGNALTGGDSLGIRIG